uniref:Uncharacterized protein n=1 Tax=Rhizophora mucronata TaxID=61149 RepID=A0A2P2R354_RHIMU
MLSATLLSKSTALKLPCFTLFSSA